MSASFLIEREREQGIESALAHVRNALGLSTEQNADVSVLSFSTLSVENAREVLARASQTGLTGSRVLVVACDRIFHEAQNALLKLFEEPPQGLTLYLVVPSRSQLLPTLASRLSALETDAKEYPISDLAKTFIDASKTEREKIIAKLLTQIKSDNEETSQQARSDAVALLGGVIILAHRVWEREKSDELRTLLAELVQLHPLLRGRSAPYKLIFEHLLLVAPEKL